MSDEHGGAAIQARELSRHFGEHVALDSLTLDVTRGEAFGASLFGNEPAESDRRVEVLVIRF